MKTIFLSISEWFNFFTSRTRVTPSPGMLWWCGFMIQQSAPAPFPWLHARVFSVLTIQGASWGPWNSRRSIQPTKWIASALLAPPAGSFWWQTSTGQVPGWGRGWGHPMVCTQWDGVAPLGRNGALKLAQLNYVLKLLELCILRNKKQSKNQLVVFCLHVTHLTCSWAD